MANPRNEASVQALREILATAKTFFLVDYQGLSAGELNELRRKVREAGGRIMVAKNTLINVVLKEQGIDGLEQTLNGPTALVLVDGDPIEPAKALTEYAKEHAQDRPAPKGGLLEGAVLAADALERIAKLPSRTQLLSEFVGVLQAPMQRLVGILQAPARDLASVLNNYAEKRKEEQ